MMCEAVIRSICVLSETSDSVDSSAVLINTSECAIIFV
jgi:hypothetical protein